MEAVDLPHLVQGMTDLLQRAIGLLEHIETRFPVLFKSLPMFFMRPMDLMRPSPLVPDRPR